MGTSLEFLGKTKLMLSFEIFFWSFELLLKDFGMNMISSCLIKLWNKDSHGLLRIKKKEFYL